MKEYIIRLDSGKYFVQGDYTDKPEQATRYPDRKMAETRIEQDRALFGKAKAVPFK